MAKPLLEYISESKLSDSFDSQFGSYYDSMKEFDYLLNFIRFHERHRANFFLLNSSGAWINLYVFSHSIFRWKRVLVFLAPGIKRMLDLIEKIYKYLCPAVLDNCDRLHRLTDKSEAVMLCVTIFDEIQHLTSMEISDSSARDHVQLVLKSRLKVFCSRIYDDFDESKVNLSKSDQSSPKIELAMVISRVPELSSCLPRRYQDHLWYWQKELRLRLSIKDPSTAHLPACLLHRLDSSDHNGQNDSCCCGWAFDSAPRGFLSLFGHSARSFAHLVHSGPQKISLREVEIHFDPHQDLNSVFGGPRIDNSSLSKSMTVFEQVLFFILQGGFCIIYWWSAHLGIDPEKIIFTDKIDRAIECFRSQVFARILQWAVVWYHEIWNSVKMREKSAEPSLEVPGPDMLPADKMDRFKEDISSGVIQMFDNFLNIIDDLELYSTYEGSSDELSEMSDNADMTSDGASTPDSFP